MEKKKIRATWLWLKKRRLSTLFFELRYRIFYRTMAGCGVVPPLASSTYSPRYIVLGCRYCFHRLVSLLAAWTINNNMDTTHPNMTCGGLRLKLNIFVVGNFFLFYIIDCSLFICFNINLIQWFPNWRAGKEQPANNTWTLGRCLSFFNDSQWTFQATVVNGLMWGGAERPLI